MLIQKWVSQIVFKKEPDKTAEHPILSTKSLQFNCIWDTKIKLQKIGGFQNSVININNLFSNNPLLIAMIYMYDLKKILSIIKTKQKIFY